MNAKPQTMELVQSANGNHVRVDGELMTFAQAHGAYGVVSNTIARTRIKEGWTVEEAMFTPAIDEMPYWSKMKLEDRVALVKKLHAKGIPPKSMTAHVRGAKAQALENFCAVHLPAAFQKPEETTEKEEKLFGWTLHSRSIDGNGVPGAGPMTLLQLNDQTCKFPISPKDVEPRHMQFCGGQACEGSPYCSEHRSRARA